MAKGRDPKTPEDEDLPEAEVEDAPEDDGTGGIDEEFVASHREEREIAGRAARKRSDFLGLMGHLYRGEMSRATTWRTRLDRTSNWAVLLVASLLTFSFSGNHPHAIILLGIIVVSIFLVIESRRYRMFDVWRSRVRMLEENVFANALEPTGAEHIEWRSLVSEDLRNPKIKIGLFEAVGRRLRRIYLALLMIMLAAWFAQLSIAAQSPWSLVAEASLWVIPGEIVTAGVLGYFLLLIAVALWPVEREAKGELEYDPGKEKWKETEEEIESEMETETGN